MTHVRGRITSVRSCGGCIEVTVTGARPGHFAIDNCIAAAWIGPEGPLAPGRLVEYRSGYVRFLDDNLAETAASQSQH